MTAELVRGQNHPLPVTRLEIRVTAATPVVAAAVLDHEDGTGGQGRVAHPGSPNLPGLEVPRQAAAGHRLAVDLGALPEAVHRVHILLALPPADGGPGAPSRFGAVAAPKLAVTALDGTGIATFTVTALDAESALVGLELYRRRGAWKVRAVGQGYADGLAALLADLGLPEAAGLTASIHEALARTVANRTGGSEATPSRPASGGETKSEPAPEREPEAQGPLDYRYPRRRSAAPPASSPATQDAPRPVAGDANGWTMEERLYNQVWGMFEDLARTTAAYRSAVDFAQSRFDRDIDALLADPATRVGPAADAARERARTRRTDLVDRARAALDRDLAQLTAESEVVEPALPPSYARWESPVWAGYRVPTEAPQAARLGDLHLPEKPELRIPLLVRLPLERGMWVDSGPGRGPGDSVATTDSAGLRRLASDVAVALAVRLLASHPAGGFSVHAIDPAGSASAALAQLTRAGVLREPPAAGAAGVTATLAAMTRRVDLVQMALRAGAPDSLPPDLDTAQQLLIVNEFPYGFDDRAVTQLRYLADEGPAVGVQLLIVADRADSREYGPVLDPLWRSLMRLTPTSDDHLADPWVGHSWTYEPLLDPPGSQVLSWVLGQITAARRP